MKYIFILLKSFGKINTFIHNNVILLIIKVIVYYQKFFVSNF